MGQIIELGFGHVRKHTPIVHAVTVQQLPIILGRHNVGDVSVYFRGQVFFVSKL